MRSIRVWLVGSFAVASLAAAMTLGTSTPSQAQNERREERREERSYWRHNNGRWDYWHAGDGRWYHTDGQHWFYHDGQRWQPYRFDRQFGREGFERGGYVAPATSTTTTIVVPQHGVYRP